MSFGPWDLIIRWSVPQVFGVFGHITTVKTGTVSLADPRRLGFAGPRAQASRAGSVHTARIAHGPYSL